MIPFLLAAALLAADPQPDDGPTPPTVSDVDRDMLRGLAAVFGATQAVACHMRGGDWQHQVVTKVIGMVGLDIMMTQTEQPMPDRIQWLKDKVAAAAADGSHPTPDDCHALANSALLEAIDAMLQE